MLHNLIAIIFYVLMIGYLVYSLLAVYTLIRFGRNRVLTVAMALVFLIVTAGIYAAAIGNLNNIQF